MCDNGHAGYVFFARRLHPLRSNSQTCGMKQLPTLNLRRSANGGLIRLCGECGAKVALVRPSASLDASPWRCRNCGVLYLASPERREGSLFRGGVLVANFSDVFQPVGIYGGPRPALLSNDDVQQ